VQTHQKTDIINSTQSTNCNVYILTSALSSGWDDWSLVTVMLLVVLSGPRISADFDYITSKRWIGLKFHSLGMPCWLQQLLQKKSHVLESSPNNSNVKVSEFTKLWNQFHTYLQTVCASVSSRQMNSRKQFENVPVEMQYLPELKQLLVCLDVCTGRRDSSASLSTLGCNNNQNRCSCRDPVTRVIYNRSTIFDNHSLVWHIHDCLSSAIFFSCR